jgi:DNA-binding SARP family transcriptional activator
VRFRLLGPLEVRSGEDWSGISAGKQRSLLAALLLHPGQAVSTERLITWIWGEEPPAKATNLVSIYVLRLRKFIGDPDGQVLVTRSPGYLLRLAPGDLDAALFTELVSQGRKALAAAAPERASALLTEALGLWRGQPLADVPQSALVEAEADRLAESRVEAEVLRIKAELACGRAASIVAGLRRMIADHPMHEELWALLMRALNASGRQAEALETYEDARRSIAAELGVDPGAELQKLYRQILEADAHPAAQPTPSEPTPSQAGSPVRAEAAARTAVASQAAEAPPPVVPSQLPADIPDFTGRGKHVKHLCDLFSNVTEDDGAGAVVVSLVAGAGGLGKTTLAVHAAHRLRAQFPDGQLYVNLLGAADQPTATSDVLARFLRELGVDGTQVPVSDEERAALYRTQLSGRRILIVLDDARDAAQVRPLLPGSASCGVLITSRKRLPDLAGVRLVDLEVLDDDEARALLVRIVGAERLEAETEATDQVLAACAGLPLAVRIAGARLATRTNWTIQTLARRLANERRRIDELKVGDLAVRACFQVSFASLPAVGPGGVDPARAFRLLGLWQGPSIGLPAAAALLGEPEDEVADSLEILVDAHLLQSPAADRYRFHDLLRVYAAEQAMAQEAGKGRDDAVHQALEWYVHAASAADHAISPHRERVPIEPAPPDHPPPEFGGVGAALDWCEAERLNLVASTSQAAERGWHDIAWKIPVMSMVFFKQRGYWTDWIATHRTALTSARVCGDKRGEAWVLNNLGMAFGLRRKAEAVGWFEQALAIRREIGDKRGEAQSANNLADTYLELGRVSEALDPLERALRLQRQVGHRYGEGVALNNLGEAYLGLGRITDAVSSLEQARDIFRQIGDLGGEGYTLHNLGQANLDLGRILEASGWYEQALAIRRKVGDRFAEAVTLTQLGRAQRRMGKPGEARESWIRALGVFASLGDDAQAAELRAELANLGAVACGSTE